MLVPFALVLSLALLAACSREADVDSPTSGAEDVTVLDWASPMPPEWQPEATPARCGSHVGYGLGDRNTECRGRV
jgi:ABC-type glycerol-3-phosphate transport system substrate-binding protein